MGGSLSRRIGVFSGWIFCAAFLLTGCTEKTADPWINEGQETLLDGQHERDQETSDHLRDRMRSGQAQR